MLKQILYILLKSIYIVLVYMFLCSTSKKEYCVKKIETKQLVREVSKYLSNENKKLEIDSFGYSYLCNGCDYYGRNVIGSKIDDILRKDLSLAKPRERFIFYFYPKRTSKEIIFEIK